MGSRLAISIDMGAVNNGVYYCRYNGEKIENKTAKCFIVDNINFSKKSRRENRHRVRSYTRRKLAKRFFGTLFDIDRYPNKEKEQLFGLFNNRGYTFLSSDSDFESIEEVTVTFIDEYIDGLSHAVTKEDFEAIVSGIDEIDVLMSFINGTLEKIDTLLEKIDIFAKRDAILKDFETLKEQKSRKLKQATYIKKVLQSYSYETLGKSTDELNAMIQKEDFDASRIDFGKEIAFVEGIGIDERYKESIKTVEVDMKNLKGFFANVRNELHNGAKPRKKYLKEIKAEIDTFSFVENHEDLYHLVSNISNLQLRILRRLVNTSERATQFKKLKNYFLTFHYKTDEERRRRKALFGTLNAFDGDIEKFLTQCTPELTIPPYEDMNNRNTYKCNSMHLHSVLNDGQKEALEKILESDYFGYLLDAFQEELVGSETRYMQRFLDVKIDETNRDYHPRRVFKEKNSMAIETFQKLFGKESYEALRVIASNYYAEESQIHNGIFDEQHSIFRKCHTNTPYKNNIKEILLKPLYDYEFSSTQADGLIEKIGEVRGLKGYMELIANKAKEYQNRFYFVLMDCLDDAKCVDDKEIKRIVTHLPQRVAQLKGVLQALNAHENFLTTVKKVEPTNIKRIINIFKQTYEILFYDIHGFNKTCKACTLENNLRSSEAKVVAKRLLSDVAKPIDGMLDMMLDRLAFEIVDGVESVEGVEKVEIFIEQNRFEFEEGLATIKGKKLQKERLGVVVICPYTGEKIGKGEYDHILPQSKGLFNSKANLIYASVKGNKEKTNKRYTLENLKDKHLKAVFKTTDKEAIRSFIETHLAKIDTDKFTNFDNLPYKQQMAFRYALFLEEETEAFKRVKDLLLKDKIKVFSNGTQKRLIKLIYQKLQAKFGAVALDAKVISSELVSATRKYLSVDQETGEINHLFKEEKQDKHSHCIDAMVLFYLATSKLKGQKHRQKAYIGEMEPRFGFDSVYVDESENRFISKRKTFINAKPNEIGSYTLFDATVYAENYRHITKESLKEKEFEILISHNLMFKSYNTKKEFISDYAEIREDTIYKIDVKRASDLAYKLFRERDEKGLKRIKFLDKFRYFTSRKPIEDIFFDKDKTKLLPYSAIKNIPPYSEATYKAIYKKLSSLENLFVQNGNKYLLNDAVFYDFVQSLYASKQKNPQERKRGKRRHRYSLSIVGAPKFRIRRGDIWQVYGNKDIASKNYIINGKMVPVPYFSRNVIPVKIAELISCLLVDDTTPSVYEVNITVEGEVAHYLSFLKYVVTEAKRCSVVVSLKRDAFDIDFDKIESFDGSKDDEFRKLIKNYINNKEMPLNDYIGSIRDALNGKATVLQFGEDEVAMEYKADITAPKKALILKAFQDETPHS